MSAGVMRLWGPILIAVFVSFESQAAKVTGLFDIYSQSVRSMGVAGAYTAIADDSSAFHLNPAGLTRSGGYRKVSSQNHFTQKPSHWALGATIIDGKTEDPIDWGFSFDTIHSPEYRGDYYNVSSAVNLWDIVSIGFSNQFTFFHTAFETPRAWDFTMNGGALLLIGDYLSVGASVQNFVRSREFDTLQPVRISEGMALNFKRLRVGGDIEENATQKKTLFKGGGEFELIEEIHLRGGYFRNANLSEHGYTLGASILASQSFRIDLAYLDRLRSHLRVFSLGFQVRL